MNGRIVVKTSHRPLVDAFLRKQEIQNRNGQRWFDNLRTLDTELEFQVVSRKFPLDLIGISVLGASSTTAKDVVHMHSRVKYTSDVSSVRISKAYLPPNSC